MCTGSPTHEVTRIRNGTIVYSKLYEWQPPATTALFAPTQFPALVAKRSKLSVIQVESARCERLFSSDELVAIARTAVVDEYLRDVAVRKIGE